MCTPTFFQDQVEAADGGGPGAAGRGGELLSAAEDVSVAVFLPPKPAGQHGQHYCSGSCRRHVQQHVPDSSCAPSPAAAAPGASRAHPRPGARGTARHQSLVQPHSRHPAPPVKNEKNERRRCSPFPCPLPDPDSCPSSPCNRPTGLPSSRPGKQRSKRKMLTSGRGPPKRNQPSSLHLPTPRDRAGKLSHSSVTGENADPTQSA